jgi:predicted nucleic acid-binding protein
VILVDTSVWVDHLNRADPALADLLNAGRVLVHPFIIGEIALGILRQRAVVLAALGDLPHAIDATHDEVLHFIERNALFGLGIGYIDAHLLAATTLTPDAQLWTRDQRLAKAAAKIGVASHGLL